jgi:hypothetical protein
MSGFIPNLQNKEFNNNLEMAYKGELLSLFSLILYNSFTYSLNIKSLLKRKPQFILN